MPINPIFQQLILLPTLCHCVPHFGTEFILFLKRTMVTTGLPGGASGKESACQCRRCGSIPGLGRSPGGGNGNPLQYSCLENPTDRGACRATVHRIEKSWTWLKWLLSLSYTHTHTNIFNWFYFFGEPWGGVRNLHFDQQVIIWLWGVGLCSFLVRVLENTVEMVTECVVTIILFVHSFDYYLSWMYHGPRKHSSMHWAYCSVSDKS